MDVMKYFCNNCSGMGKKINWKVVDTNDNISTMKKEETVCEECNGKGYTEYAIFSIEEAKAILKHCGLSTES